MLLPISWRITGIFDCGSDRVQDLGGLCLSITTVVWICRTHRRPKEQVSAEALTSYVDPVCASPPGVPPPVVRPVEPPLSSLSLSLSSGAAAPPIAERVSLRALDDAVVGLLVWSRPSGEGSFSAPGSRAGGFNGSFVCGFIGVGKVAPIRSVLTVLYNRGVA